MNPLRLSLFSEFPSYLVVVVTAKVGIKLLRFCSSVMRTVLWFFWSCCCAGTVCRQACSLQQLRVDIHSFAAEGLGTLGM